VTDSPRPTLNDVTRALAHLADRVLTHKSVGLEPYVAHTLKLVMGELELLIPGLDPAPNAEAARAFAEAAEIALREGEEREALSYALRGLSCSPHDPVLWYQAGSACVEVGSLEMALRLLWHALWINPGYADAHRDLAALTSFFDAGDNIPIEDFRAGDEPGEDGSAEDDRAA
jgi:tetratricopeptide (TPR) repeat protein